MSVDELVVRLHSEIMYDATKTTIMSLVNVKFQLKQGRLSLSTVGDKCANIFGGY